MDNEGGEPALAAEATDQDNGPVITFLRRFIKCDRKGGWERSSLPPILYQSSHYAVGLMTLPSRDQLVEQLQLAGQVPWSSTEFERRFFEGRSAEDEKQWNVAVDHYLACWKLVTETPPADESVNLWLSLCVGTRLISVYQLRLMEYPKCLDIFDRLIKLIPTRVISFELLMHRSQVFYQWSCSVKDEAQKEDLLKKALELKDVVVAESSSIDLRVFFCLGLIRLLPKCSRIGEAQECLKWVDQELVDNCHIPLEWKLELELRLAMAVWENDERLQRLRETKSKAEKNGIFIDELSDTNMAAFELFLARGPNKSQDARDTAVSGMMPEKLKKSTHSDLALKDFVKEMEVDSDVVKKSPGMWMFMYETAGMQFLKDAGEYKGAFTRSATKKQLTEAKKAIFWFEKSLRVIEDHPEAFTVMDDDHYDSKVRLYRECGQSCIHAASHTAVFLLGVYKDRAEEDQLRWVQRVRRHLKQAEVYFAKAISSLECYGVTRRSAPRRFQQIDLELSCVLCDMAVGKFWQGYYMALRGRYLRRKGIALRRMYWRKGSTLRRSQHRVFSLRKATEEVLWYLSSFRKAAQKAIEQFGLTARQLDFTLDRQAIMGRVEERAGFLHQLIEVLGFKVRAQELQNDYEAWKKGMKAKIMKKIWNRAGEEKICCRKPEVNGNHEKTPRMSRNNRLTLKQQQLVWVERSFATLFSYETLARGRFSQEVEDLCRNYATDDQLVWRTIMESQAACSSSGKATTFVVYRSKIHGLICPHMSEQHHVVYHITIIVISKTGKLVQRKTMGLPPFVSILQCITSRMSGKDMDAIDKSSSMTSAQVEEDHLKFLYKALITPISDLLASVTEEDKLVFVADKALTLVPFPILVDPKSRKFLFERHTISIAPSFLALARGNQHFQGLEKRHNTEPSLVMGDPAYSVSNRENSRRLEGSLPEIAAIQGSFRDILIEKDSDATVENLVRLAQIPLDCKRLFIHLIVHGSLDDKSKQFYLQFATRGTKKRAPVSPEPSSSASGELSRTGARAAGDHDSGNVTDCSSEEDTSLELPHSTSHRSGAGKRPGSGRLWVEDVMKDGMNWSAYMVVLSACNSARGPIGAKLCTNS